MAKYKSDYEYMWDSIIDDKELEGCAMDLGKCTACFEGAAKITADITIESDSLLPYEKQSGNENNKKKIVR